VETPPEGDVTQNRGETQMPAVDFLQGKPRRGKKTESTKPGVAAKTSTPDSNGIDAGGWGGRKRNKPTLKKRKTKDTMAARARASLSSRSIRSQVGGGRCWILKSQGARGKSTDRRGPPAPKNANSVGVGRAGKKMIGYVVFKVSQEVTARNALLGGCSQLSCREDYLPSSQGGEGKDKRIHRVIVLAAPRH